MIIKHEQTALPVELNGSGRAGEDVRLLGKISINRQIVGLHSPLRGVGLLCQLGHICEKRVRLADEKTHAS
jgi:hypothetical protein